MQYHSVMLLYSNWKNCDNSIQFKVVLQGLQTFFAVKVETVKLIGGVQVYFHGDVLS